MRSPIGKTFTKQSLLVCEGPEEAALVTELKRVRGLPDFDITCIGDQGTGNGITGLRSHLEKIVALHGFSDIDHLAILADSDDDQQRLFTEICDQIRNANLQVDVKNRYPIPNAPFVRQNGSPSITVIMQPGPAQTGCLETSLWQILSRVYGVSTACVDQLIVCAGIGAGADPWSQSKLDKARVRAAIAVIYKRNPAQSLSWLWKNAPDVIPATAPELDDLCAQLAVI